jgi:hypothetical protein
MLTRRGVGTAVFGGMIAATALGVFVIPARDVAAAAASLALMLALLPATATVVGIIVLAQIPSLRDTLGVLLVMTGVAIHRPPATGEPRGERVTRAASNVAADADGLKPHLGARSLTPARLPKGRGG